MTLFKFSFYDRSIIIICKLTACPANWKTRSSSPNTCYLQVRIWWFKTRWQLLDTMNANWKKTSSSSWPNTPHMTNKKCAIFWRRLIITKNWPSNCSMLRRFAAMWSSRRRNVTSKSRLYSRRTNKIQSWNIHFWISIANFWEWPRRWRRWSKRMKASSNKTANWGKWIRYFWKENTRAIISRTALPSVDWVKLLYLVKLYISYNNHE